MDGHHQQLVQVEKEEKAEKEPYCAKIRNVFPDNLYRSLYPVDAPRPHMLISDRDKAGFCVFICALYCPRSQGIVEDELRRFRS